MNEKIKVLVLPGLYPEYEGDPKGSFVPDYIRSVQPWCDVTVLHIRARGNPGLQQVTLHGIPVLKYGITTSGFLIRLLKPFFYAWLFYKGIQIARKQEGIRLIHAHGAAFNGLLAVLIARFIPVATVISEHTPSYKIKRSPFLRASFAYAVKHASAFLTVSKDHRQQYRDCGMKPVKEYVTYNPVDTVLFTPGNQSNSNFRNIVFAGRLVKYKGVKRLISAFISIAAKYPDWTLTICGNGPAYSSYRKIVAAANLQKRILFIPLASRQVIAEEFKKASFLAFPSEHETFGLVIAEAMSAGLPVMAGNLTAPPEQIHKGNGITVNPFSVHAIAEGLEHMMQHYNQYDAAAIRNEVIEKYGFDSFGKRLMEIYTNAIEQKK
jgi:glycosyltransferase involved in cell wall biosynthesis